MADALGEEIEQIEREAAQEASRMRRNRWLAAAAAVHLPVLAEPLFGILTLPLSTILVVLGAIAHAHSLAHDPMRTGGRAIAGVGLAMAGFFVSLGLACVLAWISEAAGLSHFHE